MSTIPSVKKHIIASLLNSCTLESLKSNQLVLVTGAGLITGYPVFKDDIETESSKNIICNLCDHFFEQYKTDFSIESPLKDNEGYFILRDATLRTTSNNILTIGEIVLFFDEIIAVSIGNISDN